MIEQSLRQLLLGFAGHKKTQFNIKCGRHLPERQMQLDFTTGQSVLVRRLAMTSHIERSVSRLTKKERPKGRSLSLPGPAL